MAYTVGQSGETDYANTSSGKVTNVVADNGVGGSGEVVNVINRVAPSLIVSANAPFLSIIVSSLPQYIAGKSDITITINSGVYVYGITPNASIPSSQIPDPVTTPLSALEILGGVSGDTITLVNNGNIVGFGGDGGGPYQELVDCSGSVTFVVTTPSKGNAALAINFPVTIVNNGFIAGGGGGGGLALSSVYNYQGGGGGAGGGISIVPASSIFNNPQPTRATPTSQTGANGVGPNGIYCCGFYGTFAGGGGGYALPGTGGAIGSTNQYVLNGVGGSSGGGGAADTGATSYVARTPLNNGGTAGNPGSSDSFSGGALGGGGGGWGASGAIGYRYGVSYQVGAVGGNTIITNGNAIPSNTGTGIYYGTTDSTTTSVTYTITTSFDQIDLDVSMIAGVTATCDLILIVPSNVIIYSTDYNNAALTLTASNAGTSPRSIRIIVNGAICGGGGIGSYEGLNTGSVGGTAIKVNPLYPIYRQVTLDCTNGYIAGGGGGGGRSTNATSNTVYIYGGGGAGGGSSGSLTSYSIAYASGATQGTQAVGGVGTIVSSGGVTYIPGGGGGTILPGTFTSLTIAAVGQYVGVGGTAGGSGASNSTGGSFPNTQSTGGSFFQTGTTGTAGNVGGGVGGGGGGWGSSGGAGKRGSTTTQVGKVGGLVFDKSSTNIPVFVINSANIGGTIA
jgi:hypothetical protein